MGRIPDEILRHRLPGTEIKQIGGCFYIQRVECVWVPEKKRRKVVLEFIRSVTADGITLKKARKLPSGVAPYLLKYGAVWVARQVSPGIRDVSAFRDMAEVMGLTENLCHAETVSAKS